MALKPADILAFDQVLPAIRQQSILLLDMFLAAPRLSGPFATQQRWLMSHIGMALHFESIARGEQPTVPLTRFVDRVHDSGVASRNTAASFVKELVYYEVAHMQQDPQDRRRQRLSITPPPLQSLHGWLLIHLSCLDALDGGNRLATFTADPGLTIHLHPAMTQDLLDDPYVVDPDGTFGLFTWLDNGGAVMDWMIGKMPDMPDERDQVAIGQADIDDMAARFGLSRTHLSRKLKEAEDLGSIGWEGKRGRSVLWVSRAFRLEHAKAQAHKLAAIDHAFQVSLKQRAMRDK